MRVEGIEERSDSDRMTPQSDQPQITMPPTLQNFRTSLSPRKAPPRDFRDSLLRGKHVASARRPVIPTSMHNNVRGYHSSVRCGRAVGRRTICKRQGTDPL